MKQFKQNGKEMKNNENKEKIHLPQADKYKNLTKKKNILKIAKFIQLQKDRTKTKKNIQKFYDKIYDKKFIEIEKLFVEQRTEQSFIESSFLDQRFETKKKL